MAKEYIIYCDESIEKGKYFSDFYGGVLISSDDIDKIRSTLERRKVALNLKNEVKWGRVTKNYLGKYKALLDTFFEFVQQNKVKIPDTNKRGKRTIAKEQLYKYISGKIRNIHPHFNIGVTTGSKGDLVNRWNHPYRHWKFIPLDFKVDGSKFK